MLTFKKFEGKTVVVKYGSTAMKNLLELKASAVSDLVLLADLFG